jgi:hypothetical protein
VYSGAQAQSKRAVESSKDWGQESEIRWRIWHGS